MNVVANLFAPVPANSFAERLQTDKIVVAIVAIVASVASVAIVAIVAIVARISNIVRSCPVSANEFAVTGANEFATTLKSFAPLTSLCRLRSETNTSHSPKSKH